MVWVVVLLAGLCVDLSWDAYQANNDWQGWACAAVGQATIVAMMIRIEILKERLGDPQSN